MHRVHVDLKQTCGPQNKTRGRTKMVVRSKCTVDWASREGSAGPEGAQYRVRWPTGRELVDLGASRRDLRSPCRAIVWTQGLSLVSYAAHRSRNDPEGRSYLGPGQPLVDSRGKWRRPVGPLQRPRVRSRSNGRPCGLTRVTIWSHLGS